jgi:hypothetical protein
MKLSELTEKQVKEAVAAVRKPVGEAYTAAITGDRAAAYAAGERAEQAAHELKLLFALTYEEIQAAMHPISKEEGDG